MHTHTVTQTDPHTRYKCHLTGVAKTMAKKLLPTACGANLFLLLDCPSTVSPFCPSSLLPVTALALSTVSCTCLQLCCQLIIGQSALLIIVHVQLELPALPSSPCLAFLTFLSLPCRGVFNSITAHKAMHQTSRQPPPLPLPTSSTLLTPFECKIVLINLCVLCSATHGV